MYTPSQPRMMNYPRYYHPNSQWRAQFGPCGSKYRMNTSNFTNQTSYNRTLSNIDDNGDHWCETCDRGFPTADVLQEHKNRHEKCNIDGCEFVAHPKIITKHIQMQHSSGLFKKIAKLNNPEEIQKWREERKRNYPTLSNIEKKNAMLKEKIERGEKMGLPRDKNKKFNNEKQEKSRKYNNENRQSNHKYNLQRRKLTSQNLEHNHKLETKILHPKKKFKTLPAVEETRTMKPFSGIHDIIAETATADDPRSDNNNDLLIEDDEETVTDKVINITSDSVVCNALSYLMCDYGSSDDDETALSSVILNKETTSQANQNANKVTASDIQDNIILDKVNVDGCKNCPDDDSGPEEVEITKSNPVEPVQNPTPNQTKTRVKQKEKLNLSRSKGIATKSRSIPSTLLQKLLFQEVRQERNIILQCIRYIRKNNYFDK